MARNAGKKNGKRYQQEARISMERIKTLSRKCDALMSQVRLSIGKFPPRYAFLDKNCADLSAQQGFPNRENFPAARRLSGHTSTTLSEKVKVVSLTFSFFSVMQKLLRFFAHQSSFCDKKIGHLLEAESWLADSSGFAEVRLFWRKKQRSRPLRGGITLSG